MSETNEKSRGGARRWPLFVGLPLIVLVAVAAVLFSGGERGSESPDPGGQGDSREAAGDGSGLGTPALGSANAPVVMLEYGDFQ